MIPTSGNQRAEGLEVRKAQRMVINPWPCEMLGLEWKSPIAVALGPHVPIAFPGQDQRSGVILREAQVLWGR